MKLCNGCHTERELSEFAIKNREKGTLSAHCKECHRRYAKAHYQRNKKPYAIKARIAQVKAIDRNRAWLVDYLYAHPCVDCGETDIEVLQFDHIEMVGMKAPRVGAYIGSSLERLQQEVAKCQMRCANCHFRRTREQLGWWRVQPIGNAR